METPNVTPRDSFTSKIGIIAAIAGSAVGLGNIWKFPYITGIYGGGAFVLVYLLCIAIIGMPVMLSEFVIGRKAQRNAIGSFKKLAPGTLWFIPGVMGLVAAFMILAFYGVVAGWTLEYLLKSILNSFAGKNPADLEGMFGGFISQVTRPIVWQILFMGLTGWIVLAGIKGGIEKASKLIHSNLREWTALSFNCSSFGLDENQDVLLRVSNAYKKSGLSHIKRPA
jgi:NSS family neurotransmitter:Na+ symporter